MAPSIVEADSYQNGIDTKKALASRKPLKSSGSLDQSKSEDITPAIGTEFPEANLVEWLNAPNADELLRDLAIKSKPLQAYLRIKSNSPDVSSLSARCRLLQEAGQPHERSPEAAHSAPRRTYRQARDLQTTHPPNLEF